MAIAGVGGDQICITNTKVPITVIIIPNILVSGSQFTTIFSPPFFLFPLCGVYKFLIYMADQRNREPFVSATSLTSIEKEKEDVQNRDSPTYEAIHPPVTRANTRGSTRFHAQTTPSDPDYVNLPYRTYSNGQALREEFTGERPSGEVIRTVKSNLTGRIERYELITWTVNDPENPKNWSKPFKWWCTMTVAATCFVVAFNSAVITADIMGPAREFHVSEEVGLLAITVFVVGFGVGKLPHLVFFQSLAAHAGQVL